MASSRAQTTPKNTVDERMLIVMKEYVHLRSTFLLISKYIEYRTPANTANKMPCQSLIQEN
jgi:hypothetical protein